MQGISLGGALIMGSQSMNTQQTAITVIGNNIANVNTPGYARERANIEESVTINDNGSELGTGSEVSDIQQIRSPMLDSLVQQSLGEQGYADQNATLASTVQGALGEGLSTGSSAGSSSSSTVQAGPIQTAITTFFGSLQNVASSPTSSTVRQVAIQNAQTLAQSINGAYSRLQQTQSDVASDASNVTTQINTLTKSIASLNQQIVENNAAAGNTQNSAPLVDTREAALEKLSGLVNVSTTTQANGMVNVSLADDSSVSLVNGVNGGGAGSTQTLSASYNATASVPLTISASTSGALSAGVPSGGSLGADVNTVNTLIGSPGTAGNTGMLGDLDTLATQLMSQVNTQNAAGYDLSGNAGGAIFSGTGAANLAVSASLVSNPSLLAAGNGSGTLDGSNAQAMAQLQNNAAILPAFQQLVTNTGEAASNATTNQTNQKQITQQLQSQQNAYSGVSIDQEMTNMINFQQAYAASGRFVTTIANMFNVIISEIPG